MSLVQPHTTASCIPFANATEENTFGGLEDPAKRDVRARWRAVASLLELRKANAPRAVKAVTTEHHARLLAISPKRLQNMVSDYIASNGDWTTLLDTTRWPIDESTVLLPAEFITEWKRRVEAHHGGIAAAHRELLADWTAWRRGNTAKAIPGYTTPPPPLTAKNEPAGWSKNNLSTKIEKAALTIMRRGLGSARKFLPQILTTRASILCGQRWEFDDYEPDLIVLAGAGQQRGKAKPLQLAALDVHSGCIPFARHKHTWIREDGKEDKWKLAHMRLFVAALLTVYGFDTESGCALVLEGGTATLDDATVDLIRDLTGGKVRVEFPPDATRRQIAPFRGASGGNPNKKPHIEAWHRLLTNELGNLRGQKGPNYSKRPEYLAGIEALQNRQLKVAAELLAAGRPDRAALIQNELLDFHTEFVPAIQGAIETINTSRNHDLEGWEQYIVPGFRLNDSAPWLTRTELLALPDQAAQEIIAAAHNAPAMHTAKLRLSRHEVFAHQMREGLETGRIQRLAGWKACELIASDETAAEHVKAIRPRSLTGAYFTVEDTRLALLSEPQIYEARILRPDGNVTELPEGDYQLIFNAFAPETIFVRDAKGRFLGVAPRAQRLNPNNEQEILEACGAKAARTAERLAPVRERHEGWNKEVAARQRHNARVAEGAAITPEEKARRRQITKNVRNVSDDDIAALTTTPKTEAQDDQSDALDMLS